VSPATLPSAAQSALAAHVAGGGSLWWITGTASTASGGARALLGGPLGSVVPLAAASAPAQTAPTLVPALSGPGAASALTSLDADAATSAEVWQSLPPVGSGDPGVQAHASAEVLVHGRPAGGRVTDQSAPLVATREDAGGRVLVWNGSGFFRWRLTATENDRLVDVQPTLVRAAMTWLLVEGGASAVGVTPSAAVVRHGDVLRFAGSVRGSAAGVDMSLSLRPADRADAPARRVPVRLSADSASFLADVDDLPPGRYAYAARAVRGGRVLGNAAGEVVVDARSLDAEDVTVSEDALRSLARESGGAYVRATDDGLAEAVRRLTRRPREVTGPRVELWSHPAALVLALGLLGVEWFLRKRWGLL
jgi:hypothetical protein